MFLEILLAYTYTIIIGAIVGLGNVSSEKPGDIVPAVSESIPVENPQPKVGSKMVEGMNGEDAEFIDASQAELNRYLSKQTIKEEVSSPTLRDGRINDVFQEEGGTQDHSNFESWAK